MTPLRAAQLAMILAAALLLNLPEAAQAGGAEDKGLAIAQEMQDRDAGWKDQTAELVMVLRNRQGQESRREIRTRSLEIVDDGDKSLTIFDKPRDVAGTAFLSFTHPTTSDDQWLYLPALKRVKRISSSNKSGPFMGSEFAYEDLSSQEVARYSYKFLRDEGVDGRPAMVVERYPAYKQSGYTRQVTWIDAEYWQPIKIEFYDRRKALLKTMTYQGYKQYQGKHWRPDSMLMTNHQSGKSTLLEWRNYQHGTGLRDGDFNKAKLKRLR